MQRRPLLALSAFAPLSAFLPAAHAAAVGQTAPDFSLPDTAGRPVRLSDFRGRHVVLEWHNPGCPFVRKHYQGNMQALQKAAREQGLAWLTINSTEEASADYLSPAELGAWMAQHQALPTATLMDPQGRVGRAYAARVTPHLYIVDPQGLLAYAGGIDSIASARVEDIAQASNYLRLALADIAAGRPLSTRTSRPYGCSIKYAAG